MTGLGPSLPANWYLLGPARDLRAGTISTHTIGDRDIIVYRGEQGGSPVAMAAHCEHMGCHLGNATVRGTALRCPLHFRLISADGRFAASEKQPMRQPTFPLQEFMGGLFIYLGDPASAQDLKLLGIEDNPSCYAGEHTFPLPWQWLVANGLDIEHLSSVHDRDLLAPPALIRDGNRELTVRYHTRPRAAALSDRLMNWISRDGVYGTIRAMGGSMMLVEARVGARETFILLSFAPQRGVGTTIRGIVGLRGKDNLLNRVSVIIARVLFTAFLRKDLHVLDGIRWHEPRQVDSVGDEYTRQLCAFFRDLPDA